MANTKSAQKAARQTIRRTEVNKSRRSEMRTYVRKVEEAIASKDPKAAAEALSAAEPRLARAAQKGIVHKNAASRKISRLTKRVKVLAGWTGGTSGALTDFLPRIDCASIWRVLRKSGDRVVIGPAGQSRETSDIADGSKLLGNSVLAHSSRWARSFLRQDRTARAFASVGLCFRNRDLRFSAGCSISRGFSAVRHVPGRRAADVEDYLDRPSEGKLADVGEIAIIARHEPGDAIGPV